ncbi:type II secretion system protein N [Lysobacter sp. A3-1-A15]|uniref:type II secretion system protein N n=1 Tax=Novilysobacter viscosus TaxID=3098602 RepID=UPI002EDACA5D
MTVRHLLLALVLAFAASLVVFAPLGLAARSPAWPAGLSVLQAHGTLWRGHLSRVAWGGHAFDAVDAGLHPLSWVLGVPRVRLRTGELDLAWSGGRVQGLHHGQGGVELPAGPSWGGLSLGLHLEALQMLFADGRCLRAGGRLHVQADGAALPAGPLELAGQPRCEGDEARVVLTPRQALPDQPDIRADLAIGADGRYRLAVRVASQDPVLGMALLPAGFQAGPAGFSRMVEGQLGD